MTLTFYSEHTEQVNLGRIAITVSAEAGKQIGFVEGRGTGTLKEMNRAAECLATIPCHNEAAGVGTLTREVRSRVGAVLVIDDGSSDGTAEVAQQAGAEVLKMPRCSGKGAALQRGWEWGLCRGYRWALTLDGDGQHRPEDIPRFFGAAEATGARLVIGNRMGAPERMPLVRRWVNQWMSRRLSELTGMCVPDSQCGFRLLDLQAWRGLEICAEHFEIESEVLLAFARAGYAVTSVPVKTVYGAERSKIHPVRDTARWLRWWARARRRCAGLGATGGECVATGRPLVRAPHLKR